MPISKFCSPRPIDAAQAKSRLQLAAITAIDREAINAVSHDPAAARRLALLASELRRVMTEELELPPCNPLRVDPFRPSGVE